MKVLSLLWRNESNYGLLTDNKFSPFVISRGFHPDSPEGEQWDSGSYYSDFTSFMIASSEYLCSISYGRMAEIASDALDGIFVNDEEQARIYMEYQMELDEEEMVFFGKQRMLKDFFDDISYDPDKEAIDIGGRTYPVETTLSSSVPDTTCNRVLIEEKYYYFALDEL